MFLVAEGNLMFSWAHGFHWTISGHLFFSIRLLNNSDVFIYECGSWYTAKRPQHHKKHQHTAMPRPLCQRVFPQFVHKKLLYFSLGQSVCWLVNSDLFCPGWKIFCWCLAEGLPSHTLIVPVVTLIILQWIVVSVMATLAFPQYNQNISFHFLEFGFHIKTSIHPFSDIKTFLIILRQCFSNGGLRTPSGLWWNCRGYVIIKSIF